MAAQDNIPSESSTQAGYRIYHGLDSVQSVDWLSPIGFLPEGNQQVALPLAMAPGEQHILAVRHVSAAGVEEQSTHVWTLARIDDQGNLLPPPLPEVQDLAITQTGQEIKLSFTCMVQIPCVTPTSFDVLCDGGTGELNLANPAAFVSYSRTDQTEFEVSLSDQSACTLLAVRPRRDSQVGPMSQISVNPGPNPLPPQAL